MHATYLMYKIRGGQFIYFFYNFFFFKSALTCGRSFGSIKMVEMTRNETALNCVTVAKTVLASFLSRRDHVAPKH